MSKQKDPTKPVIRKDKPKPSTKSFPGHRNPPPPPERKNNEKSS
ncbi:hypothetical protein [Chondrinema litorale]|nr:hypothetical protein [Chondrinema litorale]UZS00215.1 hypothetical protein OQ292_40355 [Chondrinema litorale]